MNARNTNLSPVIRLRPEVCSVAVAYEDVETRDFAISLCEHLEQRFAGDLEFEFTWWGFKYLSDPEISREAAEAAMNADLIMLSVHRARDFAFEVEEWFRHWSEQRTQPDGALVVVESEPEHESARKQQESNLLSLARRAKMDYLRLAETKASSAPKPSEGFPSEDGRYHSSGWGINE
jgi:hypothetical protein